MEKPCNGCGAKCCYDGEVRVDTPEQEAAMLAANPYARVSRGYVIFGHRCGNVDPETGACMIYGTAGYPGGCADFERDGPDCNYIRKELPIGFIPINDIEC
jgi:hypothetical protein